MNPKLFVKVCEMVFDFKYESWVSDLNIPTEAIEELATRVDMSLSRLTAYVQVIMENRKLGQDTPFFDKILSEEFGYSDNMPFPALKSWWPEGLNHGLDDIFEKYALER